MSGVQISSPVVVFDDDHYYLGGVLAERLRAEGLATIPRPLADLIAARDAR